jgi:hypothetical protein
MEADKETRVQDRDSDIETGSEKEEAVPAAAPGADFPDGGLRAWSVAIGAAGVLFCTFGYANAFGYANHFLEERGALRHMTNDMQYLSGVLSSSSAQRQIAF